MKLWRKTGAVSGWALWLCLASAGLLRAATLTVTSDASSGAGTLAWAVGEANALPGLDNIVFALPGSQRIIVDATLSFFDPVVLDGGQVVVLAMNPAEPNATILAFLSGSAGSTIRNVALTRSYCGLFLLSGQHRITGCALGTDWADAADAGNTIGAIVSGPDVWIGGAASEDRNLISGNFQYGVLADGAVNLRIQGNYIGTDSTGTLARPNLMGVMFWGNTTGSLVGGTRGAVGTLGEGNLFAGNLYHLQIDGHAATGNTLCGNLLGVIPDQSASLPSDDGVTLRSTSGNWVGLPAAGKDNIICANRISGIAVDGLTPSLFNVLQNNRIGVNELGQVLPNGVGIILGGDANLVGGDRAPSVFERNVIAGNLNSGVQILGHGNTVSGNLIGVKADGTSAAGNYSGVFLAGHGNLIGGSNADSAHPRGNVISGHAANLGIHQIGGGGNRILGNLIGMDEPGTSAVPNFGGVYIQNAASHDTVLGNAGGSGNFIAGNSGFGAVLENTSDHRIAGNLFGLLPGGGGEAVNGGDALTLRRTAGCLVGGAVAGEGNRIVGTGVGVLITQPESAGNTLLGNRIGVLDDGSCPAQRLTAAVRLDGGAHGNWIGIDSGAGNLLANAGDGILLDGPATDANALYGNTIAAFTGAGVVLRSGANRNQPRPSITMAEPGAVAGTAQAGDRVEVFLAERGEGLEGGALRTLGWDIADALGHWSVSVPGLASGVFVCALATDSSGNTSMFSLNGPVLLPATSTPTVTPTPTPTPTLTPTGTCTPSPSVGASATVTSTGESTLTATATVTPTSSRTSTPTPGATTDDATPSVTLTQVGNASAGEIVIAPNPACLRVRCWVRAADGEEVKAVLFNIMGERVAVMTSPRGGAVRVLDWDCAGEARGVYFIQVHRGNRVVGVKKIALIR